MMTEEERKNLASQNLYEAGSQYMTRHGVKYPDAVSEANRVFIVTKNGRRYEIPDEGVLIKLHSDGKIRLSWNEWFKLDVLPKITRLIRLITRVLRRLQK